MGVRHYPVPVSEMIMNTLRERHTQAFGVYDLRVLAYTTTDEVKKALPALVESGQVKSITKKRGSQTFTKYIYAGEQR